MLKLKNKLFKSLVATTLLSCSVMAQTELQKITYLLPAPPTIPAFAPWVIAQYKGYYQENNLQVSFITAKGGVDVAKQVGAGNAMVGGAIGDTPLIVRANRIPVKAVAVLGSGGVALIATRADKNINNVADLKGKIVTAMSYSDTTYYALLASLKKAGLTKDDLSIEAAGPNGVWQLFASDKADAMAAVPEWVVTAEENGTQVKLIPQQQLFDSMAQAIIASEDAINNHPEVVQGVVNGTLRGLQDVLNNPQAAATTFAKAVPAYQSKEAYLVKVFELYKQYVYGQQNKLGLIDTERLEKVRKFYLDEKIVLRNVPLNDLYTNQFVEASKLTK